MSENEVDRLSELTDDILISIISRLSFQEATATCILSTRWRLLHTLVLSLNFHFAFKPYKSFTDLYTQMKKYSDYISRVNHALDSYNKDDHMHVPNALRVHMPFPSDNIIDKWVHFALSRKVETIDLRLNSYTIYDCSILDLVTRMCKDSLLGVKELSLSLICLDDQDIVLILSNFVFLEHLSIDGVVEGKSLVNPRVVGHCKLTHVNISSVWTIKSIEVRDMINLVSLKFCGMPFPYDLLLDSVPNLVHFNNDDGRHKMLADILPKISCIHHQLLHLKLSIFPNYIKSDRFTLPKLINLKHMELNVGMNDKCGTHQLFPLIEACPSLEKLEIKFSWSFDPKCVRRKLHQKSVKRKKPSYNLKKVRLSGYLGSVSELELAMYLMNNAVALQELIVEACDITPNIRKRAFARASYHLQSIPLNSVNLVII